MDGMAENGWIGPEMAGNGQKWLKMVEIAGNSWKWMEQQEIAGYG